MTKTYTEVQPARERVEPCPTCGNVHAAYALFPPACQYRGDRHTVFVDGRRA